MRSERRHGRCPTLGRLEERATSRGCWLSVYSRGCLKSKAFPLQSQEDQARSTEGKLMESKAAVSLLALARLEVGVKLAGGGVCDLHHTAPTRPRAPHLQAILLTGCRWLTLRLPGSETPLHEASRPGPLSLLNPASVLISCLFARSLPDLS